MRRRLFEALGRLTWKAGKKYGPRMAKEAAARAAGGRPNDGAGGRADPPPEDQARGGAARR